MKILPLTLVTSDFPVRLAPLIQPAVCDPIAVIKCNMHRSVTGVITNESPFPRNSC